MLALFAQHFDRPHLAVSEHHFARPISSLAAVGLATLALVLLGTKPVAAASVATGTLVEFNYGALGTVRFDLFDELTPLTVNNFVNNYVNTGRYDQSMVHRVDKTIQILQGGGFDVTASPIATPADTTVQLEYARANTRGTIAMARTLEPNSANSQWFVNAQDNSQILGPQNNGGYAVFGWVVGPGMSTIDSIVSLPIFPYATPFGQIPLQNYTQDDYNNQVDPLPHVVELQSVTVVGTHPAFQNPYDPLDVNNSGLVSPLDALNVISSLIEHGVHEPAGPFTGDKYLDVTGDGIISPLDALRVIGRLLNPPTEAEPAFSWESEPLAITAVAVPEPGSLLLATIALVAVITSATNRRRLRT
jgi:peptidyl-prolyl cis-trans isomerase A (cyclophilin A)